MTTLRIHTQIQNRFTVFDASGQLPFSIIFGFCRRSPTDTDERSITFDVARTVLDVPYALANGLLTLHERDGDGGDGGEHEIDTRVSHLADDDTSARGSLVLPSPAGRPEQWNWRESFTLYYYVVKPNSALASMLRPGKKYAIRLASEDLGIESWAYVDPSSAGSLGQNSQDPKPTRLVNSKPTGGNATFKVKESLSMPPQLHTRLQLHANGTDESRLMIHTCNMSEEQVTLQTHGKQQFLIPWGLFQPELDSIDDRPRILDSEALSSQPTSSLLLTATRTGNVIKGGRPRLTAPLTDGSAPKRPKIEWLTSISAGDVLTKEISLNGYVAGLDDGLYSLRMQEKGCWWCWGKCKGDENGLVPRDTYHANILPAILKSDDTIEFSVREGKVFPK